MSGIESRAKERSRGRRKGAAGGFSLLEIMLAVAIMAAVSTVTYMAFSTIVIAWRRGVALTDHLHHGDFVMEQLVMALRSTYFPDSDAATTRHGFWLEDDGDGETESDVISWVKLGSSLVGNQERFQGTPHRVTFYVDKDEDGEQAVLVKAWRLDGQPEDFDPLEDVDPVPISRYVTGFNCRTISPDDVDDDGEFEWQDEWNYTNDLPLAVELTLYLPPIQEGGDALAVKRILEIPVAYLCEPWTKTGESDELAP